MIDLVSLVANDLGHQNKNNPIVKTIGSMSDAMLGIISICKGDLSGIESIAKLMGSFNLGKVKQLILIFSKFARFLSS